MYSATKDQLVVLSLFEIQSPASSTHSTRLWSLGVDGQNDPTLHSDFSLHRFWLKTSGIHQIHLCQYTELKNTCIIIFLFHDGPGTTHLMHCLIVLIGLEIAEDK